MSSPDGLLHVAFNGEIYNFLELRSELSALGYTFKSQSDTEVLLAAYAAWGKDAPRRFVGMFAFALLDIRCGKLILARDYFGIKPLYYSGEDGRILFGSEIKALFALGLNRRTVNPERLLYFLRYGMTDFGTETMFSAVNQLPPGHYIEIFLETGAAEEPVSYWQADSGPPLDISFDEAAQKVRELFLRSVELHLRSDVPVGTALSGGIDSSSIACAMRYLNDSADIHAFGFISEESETSEERWIDLVGRSMRINVHKIRVSSRDFRADLGMLSRFHDEPFARTSTHAQFEIFRTAREANVKVMLDGQGADEILAGYRLYLGARLATLIRGGEWSEAVQLLRGMSELDSFSWVQGLLFCADYIIPPALQSLPRQMVRKEAFPNWLNERWFADRKAGVNITNHTRALEVLKFSLTRSVREGLPGLLRYEDRNSMAASVESRVPFLTPDLVNFVGRLPEKYLISSNGTSKAVFRKAMRGIVPDPILDRRDKLGFETPERLWLTQLDEWVGSMLDSETVQRMPFFNVDNARKEWSSIRAGKRRFDSRIWRWLSMIFWAELFEVSFD